MTKEKEIQSVEPEIVDAEPKENELQEVLPNMNISVPQGKDEGELALVTDESLLGIYAEVMDNIREDRDELAEMIGNFGNMVFNGEDAGNASKEALVNLMKEKLGTADKMAKIADLMTRVKLKEPNTYKPYLNATQTNTVNISTNEPSKRELIENLQKRLKK
tara:strand:- start:205 stop:690 length:486 start_codon:yes stop_codon:yes gene_type:complete